MITLKWARFPESDVVSYKVFRSIIGFSAPIMSLTGKTLVLKVNGSTNQTFTFSASPIVNTINATIVNGRAFLSDSGTRFIVRSNVRVSPGSVEIISGTALADLGLTPHLITERSESELLATVMANVIPTATEQYPDPDGVLDDFYAISSVSSLAIESLKTPWRQPIQTAGPLCVVEGTIADLQGVRIPDAEIIATLQVPPKSLTNTYITKDAIRTLSGPDGRFSLPLLQCALVKLEVPLLGYMKMVTIPKQSYIFIKDLLVDDNYTYPIGLR